MGEYERYCLIYLVVAYHWQVTKPLYPPQIMQHNDLVPNSRLSSKSYTNTDSFNLSSISVNIFVIIFVVLFKVTNKETSAKRLRNFPKFIRY